MVESFGSLFLFMFVLILSIVFMTHSLTYIMLNFLYVNDAVHESAQKKKSNGAGRSTNQSHQVNGMSTSNPLT